MSFELALPLVLVFSVGSLFVAGFLASWVLKKDTGTSAMQAISNAIKEGAEAFLRRQNRTIGMLAVLLAVVIFLLYGFVRGHHDFDPVPTALRLAFWTTLSFALGAACSVIAGYIGMWVSIRANIRTASAARTSLNDALRIALRGGAVSGLFVVAMSLFGVGGLYWLVSHFTEVPPAQIPLLIVGYGFGASFVALFAQLGGGIYTKAADVGADLVGKVEAGIPEDDPRNPAVIADLVGDNVGDCAGRGADLFESTAAENIGAMILGATLAAALQKQNMAFSAGVVGVMLFPLVARAFGLLASIIGIFAVKTREDADPMQALNRGYYIAAALAIAGFFVATKWLLANPSHPDAWWMYFFCGMIGVLTSIVFVFITQYYTEYKYRPVREIAEASQTGPATNIIAGIAVGFECTLAPVIAISIAILSSYKIGVAALPGGGLFGTAVATMGMLGTAAYILAMDTFGPITDNAGGIVEMSKQPEEIRKKTDRLDAVGNTTKALTKGYAIGSAALAAFLLFSAYLDELKNYGAELTSVNLAKPEVFVGRAHRRDAGLLLLRPRDQGRRQGGLRRHPGRSRSVQGAPGHHAGHREAGLRPHGGHRHAGRPAPDDRAGPGRRRHADRRRPGLQAVRRRRRGGGGAAHGRHDRRNRHGDLPEQRRRRLGQRQEVHRDRRLRRQGLPHPQGGGGRGHRR